MNEIVGSGTGTCRSYPVYQTDLADAILPAGDDFLAIEVRSRCSEMLVKHWAAGGETTFIALEQALAVFTPDDLTDLSLDMDPCGMNKLLLSRWCDEQRPQILRALKSFFVEGGFEKRVYVQRKFLSDLADAGLTVEGMAHLRDRLAIAGRWHDTFITLLLSGRHEGVSLRAANYDDRLVRTAAQEAGFGPGQINFILGHIIPVQAPEKRRRPGIVAKWMKLSGFVG